MGMCFNCGRSSAFARPAKGAHQAQYLVLDGILGVDHSLPETLSLNLDCWLNLIKMKQIECKHSQMEDIVETDCLKKKPLKAPRTNPFNSVRSPKERTSQSTMQGSSEWQNKQKRSANMCYSLGCRRFQKILRRLLKRGKSCRTPSAILDISRPTASRCFRTVLCCRKECMLE